MTTSTHTPARLVLSTLALFALALPASLLAVDYNATITSGTTVQWGTNTTWTPTGVPGTGDNVSVNSTYTGGASNLHIGDNRTIDTMALGGSATTYQFRILNSPGNTLTTSNITVAGRTVAFMASATGSYNINTTNLTVDTNNNAYILQLGAAAAGTQRGVNLNVTGNTTVTSGAIHVGVGSQTINLGHLDLTTRNLYLSGTSFNSTVSGNNVLVSVRSLSGSSGSLITNGNATSDTANSTLKILGENGAAKAYGGVIEDGKTGSLTTVIKEGAGTQIFSGANTYTGGTTITGGILQIGAGGTSGTAGCGTITNNATLAFNRSDSYTPVNLITGNGVVQQAGSGTLIFSSNNTYSGGTEISAGTLQIGGGGTSGAVGTGAISNNSTLQVDRSDIYTLSNAISGSGAFRQNGTGTTILTAANTYTGTTTVNGGVLQMGNGGTTGTISNNGNLTIGGSGKFVVNRSDSVTLSNVINGSGAFEQAGTGTTILGANSSGFNGDIFVNAGTLNFGGGVSGAGIGSGTITNNSTVVFQRTSGSIMGNVFLGTGTLIFRGSSKVFLSNDNTSYAGDITIESGARLQFGVSSNSYATGSIAGAITNNGELTVYRNNAFTLGNTISGAGNLIKDGTGTTTLTAMNTYTGNTTVTAGTLILDNGAGLTFKVGNNGVNNSIGGTSTLTLNGQITFDLSGADTTYGNTWGIVDMLSLAASYGGTFNVTSSLGAFTESLDVWSLTSGGNTWSFTEATGVLTVVPEPHVSVLVALGALAMSLTAPRRRKA